MANLAKAIVHRMKSDPLIGGVLGERVFPISAPQGAQLPYLVYRVVSVEPFDTKDGVSTLDSCRVQFELVDKSYGMIVQTAEAIRANMDRLRGDVAGTFIDGCRYLDYTDDFSPEPGIYNHFCDYQIRYHRP